MSEVAEKTAEVTAEVVEEALDGVVDVVEVVRTNPVAAVAAGVVGVLAGGVGGYFLAKKRLKPFYEDLAQTEIAEARQFFSQVNKVDEDGAILSPMDVLTERHGADAAAAVRRYQGRVESEEDLIAVAQSEQGHPSDEEMDEAQITKIEARLRVEKEDDEEEVVEETVVNVFTDDIFDLDEERKHRTEEAPYIITHEEFYEAEYEYDTSALTYYAEDNTLVDERDNPINDVENVVGTATLTRFGSGAKDKNTVHVRNHKLQTEYEITRSTGSYIDEVLGLSEEPNTLRHANRHAVQDRRRRAPRPSDE